MYNKCTSSDREMVHVPRLGIFVIQAGHQDFAAGGAHLLNAISDIRRTGGPNMKWGGTYFKWEGGGRAPTSPRWRRPSCYRTYSVCFNLHGLGTETVFFLWIRNV